MSKETTIISLVQEGRHSTASLERKILNKMMELRQAEPIKYRDKDLDLLRDAKKELREKEGWMSPTDRMKEKLRIAEERFGEEARRVRAQKD